MPERFWTEWRWGLLLVLLVVLLSVGCSPYDRARKWMGYERGEDESADEAIPPEAQQETVMIDGKPYVRSRNPYYLAYADQPEYIYVPKGQEFVGLQQQLINAVARAVGKEKEKAAGKTIPPDKLQDLVRAEVDRILRDQGLGGFVSRGGGKELGPYVGRAVAVIPNPETPRNYEAATRSLAVSLGEAWESTEDIKVSDLEQVKAALGKAGARGKLSLRPNIQALGDFLGVQGIVLTNIISPEKGPTGFLGLEQIPARIGLMYGSDGVPPPHNYEARIQKVVKCVVRREGAIFR